LSHLLIVGRYSLSLKDKAVIGQRS
jgi:hypothetical protein